MNITEIATAAVDRIDPTIKKIIRSHESATHPEIVNNRKGLIEKRERMIETVTLAITDAIAADRMCSELRYKNYDHVVTEICCAISPHTPRELCTTLEAVEWLVERHKAATAAMLKLEEIRTDKLAQAGFSEEPTAISEARHILRHNSKLSQPTSPDNQPDR